MVNLNSSASPDDPTIFVLQKLAIVGLLLVGQILAAPERHRRDRPILPVWNLPAEGFEGHSGSFIPFTRGEITHEITHDEYGLPHEDYGVPHDDYGVPHEDYGVPHEEYGPPRDEPVPVVTDQSV